MNDKVAILLPTRNRWQILFDRALKSILNQTHKNWHLFIVHDGLVSERITLTDDRVSIFYIDKVYTYPKTDKKAEWLAGACNALNKALSQVNETFDYIARIDDDDEWKPFMLQEMIDFLKSSNVDFVSALWENEHGIPSETYSLDDLGLGGISKLGGVQTWLYKAKHKYTLYDGECWKKSLNANNELDWFERFFKGDVTMGFYDKVVCTISPRPGETEIGSKAYVK
jgi:glycosyltransferase involved in cell wall biosynthesis